MTTLYADAILDASGTSPLYKRTRLDKLGEQAPSLVVQTIVGGVYTWGALACIAAGGGWIILGAFCILGAVGSVVIVGNKLVYILS